MHNFNHHLVQYLVALVIFLAIDSVWLGVISIKTYRKYIGHLMSQKPNFPAAAIFYFSYAIGLVIFAISRSNNGSIAEPVLYGALFGLFTYGTFDLTNQAVLKKWPTQITIIDMVWGVVLCSSVTALTCLILG